MDNRLVGKTALITGASSGIGAALAREFARRGASLILLARNRERLEAVRGQCAGLGAGDIRLFEADTTDYAAIDAFVPTVEGTLDFLILNAGISQRSLAVETAEEVDRKVMEVDFFAPVHLTKALYSAGKWDRHTRIAATSSISGLFGFPQRSAYCAAKHALKGFYEALRLENGMSVTVIFPGRINTPISLSALEGDGKAHGKMDPGQAGGMDADRCARKCVEGILRGKPHVKVGGKEMISCFLYKWFPGLFFKFAGKVSAV
ncbi:MAG: SDR family NAD(P)-dependent oxidoreductase [Bacteroidales bacterium]|nr:SDR family NAD(P)-dependent oxidoreductase [Bacteroidales bacterium]